jgi:hypothetical protein
MKSGAVALAAEIGAAMGEMQAGLDELVTLYVRMGERIANLEKRVNELTPKPRARRSPPRRKLRDVLAAAE